MCLVFRLLTFGIALTRVLASVQAEPLTIEKLENNYFQRLRIAGGKLEIQFFGEGSRFLVQPEKGESRLSEYGEVIAIAPGEKMRLSQKHGSFSFFPLLPPLEARGLWLRKSFNARSLGGKLVETDAIVVIAADGPPVLVPLPPGSDPARPLDEATRLRVLESAGRKAPLATHVLQGELPDGTRGTPPFSSKVLKLHLAWELASGVRAEPLGVRWIAADTGGVAAKDHVVSSGKSEPGKKSGVFTLSAPAAGFPPGTYRVELWQEGKLIGGETFEISK